MAVIMHPHDLTHKLVASKVQSSRRTLIWSLHPRDTNNIAHQHGPRHLELSSTDSVWMLIYRYLTSLTLPLRKTCSERYETFKCGFYLTACLTGNKSLVFEYKYILVECEGFIVCFSFPPTTFRLANDWRAARFPRRTSWTWLTR